mmetsp:Transcript_57046/g.105469  ORF Transcript_57046/g.105469 Transcript_57046/m.105469 type:complete len:261 (+) Transcript_57046:89-871(+)
MASCTTYTCPTGYIGRSDAASITCQSSPCTSADKSACCTVVSKNVNAGLTASDSSCGNNHIIAIGCNVVGNSSALAGQKPTFSAIFTCPASCTGEGTAFGTGVYAMDSNICLAAIHAGVITVGGGNLKATVQDGLPAYYGSLRNGVRSISHAPTSSSFLASIPTTEELRSNCDSTTTTDMPWGWPWWAWFTLCMTFLLVCGLLAGLFAVLGGGSSKKKKRKGGDVEKSKRSRDRGRTREYEVIDDAPPEQSALLSPRSRR